MEYRRFFSFNVVGAIVWVVLLAYGGYLFGNIPWVKQNISLVVIGIIVLSILPGVVEYIRAKRAG
jgi:membrane-associated protein